MALLLRPRATFLASRLQEAAKDAKGPSGDRLSMVCCSDLRVAVVMGGRSVLVLENDETVTEVAKLSGIKALAWVGRGSDAFLVAGYANGLLKALDVPDRVCPDDAGTNTGENSIAKEEAARTKGFKIREAGIIDLCVTIDPKGTQKLWILYTDQVVVAVDVAQLVLTSSWTELDSTTWHLKGQADCVRFGVFPQTKSNSDFEVDFSFALPSKSQPVTIVTVGSRPTWASFRIDTTPDRKLQLKETSLSTLATSLSSVTNLAKSWVFGTKEQLASEDGESSTPDPTLAPEGDDAFSSPHRARGPFSRRRKANLWHGIYDSATRTMGTHFNTNDPSGRYCVSVDQLGRVVLVDSHGLIILKVWKGYRDAQTAWLHSPEQWESQWDDNSRASDDQALLDLVNPGQVKSWGQYLVILAPWRQTIQVWRVPGYVLVASFRDPSLSPGNAWLVSTDGGEGIAQCAVLRKVPDKESRQVWESSVVHLTLKGLEKLIAYQSSGENQHKNFVLHQVRRALAQDHASKAVSLVSKITNTATLAQVLSVIDSHIPFPASFDHKEQAQLVKAATRCLSVQGSSNSSFSDLETKQVRASMHSILERRETLIGVHQVLKDCIGQAGGEARQVEEDQLQAASWITDVPPESLEVDVAKPMALLPFLRLFGASFRGLGTRSWSHQALNVQEKLSSLEKRSLAQLGALLFEPLLFDVFSFGKLEGAINTLQISVSEQCRILLTWWFQSDILQTASAVANPRNALSHFLERFVSCDEESQSEDDSTSEHSDSAEDSNEALSSGSEKVDLPPAEEPGASRDQPFQTHLDLIASVCSTTGQAAHALLLVSTINTLKVPLAAREKAKFVALEQKLKDVVFLLQHGAAERWPRLSIETLAREGSPSFCEVAAQLDDSLLELWFPGHLHIARDAILCFRAQRCAEVKALGSAITHLETISDPRVQCMMTQRIWEGATLDFIANAFEDQSIHPEDLRPVLQLLDLAARSLEAAVEISDTLSQDDCSDTQDGNNAGPEQNSRAEAGPPRKSESKSGKGVDLVPGFVASKPSSTPSLKWPPIGADITASLLSDWHSIRPIPANIRAQRTAVLVLQTLFVVGGHEAATRTIVQQVFPKGASVLCPGSLFSPQPEDKADDLVESRRFQLVVKRLKVEPTNPKAAHELAKAFNISRDRVLREQIALLFGKNLDSVAEPLLHQVEDRVQMGLLLLAIARARMAHILVTMQENPKHRHLLAVVSADTSRWIRAVGEKPKAIEVAGASALSSTLILLRWIQEALPESHSARNCATQVMRAADALFRRVQELR